MEEVVTCSIKEDLSEVGKTVIDNPSFIVPIKKEYLVERSQLLQATMESEGKHQEKEQNNHEEKNKHRGRNKKRPTDERPEQNERLCPALAKGGECAYGSECRFMHDVADVLKRREKDIGDECILYKTYGFCPFGLNCRFGGQHTNRYTGENLKRPEEEGGVKEIPQSMNILRKDIQAALRKNKYPFKCQQKRNFKNQGNNNDKHAKGLDQPAHQQEQEEVKDNEVKHNEINDNEVKDEQKCDEHENTKSIERNLNSSSIPYPRKVKLVDFSNKVYVAPLTTVGNLPFRRVMKEFGADITCGEMALSTNLLSGQSSEWALLKRHSSEDIFGVQIAGAHADQITRVCELIEAECQVDFVDLNMGCPIDLVCEKGGGSSLMTRGKKVEEIVTGMTGALSCPITVKMRTGWDEKKPLAHSLIPLVQRIGQGRISAIMVHGRSRLQRYTKNADWNYIVNQVGPCQNPNYPRIPVIGHGDTFSYTDWQRHIESDKNNNLSSCCMIARGALIKPWLPMEIKEQRHIDLSSSERLDILKRFVHYGLEHWGSDQQGVNNTRRFLLEWLSFLHRYVPVGLLEVAPQRLNDRPPPFVGRDELETLMASGNCQDWIRISEMLIGPVPHGFQFVPKHKANSYAPEASVIQSAQKL